MTSEVTNREDLIDSRDVIDRIEELEEHRDNPEEYGEFDADLQEELDDLQNLADEASMYAPDWEHGETLIRASYFTTYAEEFASDIGAIDRNASWPLAFIDWEAAADNLLMDYTEVDFGGVPYYIR